MSAPREPPDPRDPAAEDGERGSVFEANLRALLQRAYEPALPSEAFRVRAEAALLAALPAPARSPLPPRRAAGARRPAQRTPVLMRLVRRRSVLAQAALLLLALTAWWFSRAASAPADHGAAPVAGGELVPPSATAPGTSPVPGPPGPGTSHPPEPLGGETAEAPPAAPPLVAQLAPLELGGRVTDAITGAPIARFRVSIVRDHIAANANLPASRDVEDADGRFRWPDIEADTWALYVHADGYAVASRTGLLLDAGAALPPLQIALERGAAVRGFVVDAASGSPVEGAVVLSETDSPMRNVPLDAGGFPREVTAVARTAGDGTFELSPLSTGPQRLRATARGFAPQWTENLVVPAGAGPVEGLLFRMEPGAGMAGRVTNAAGEPWPMAVVLAWHADMTGRMNSISYGLALTDAQGRYEIADLPAGPTQAIMIGGARPEPSSPPPQVQPVDLASGQVATVNFLGAGSGGLRGTAVDAQGQPVPGLGISVARADIPDEKAQASWRATVSAADGGFELADLQPGAYQLFVGTPTGGSLAFYGALTLPPSGLSDYDLRVPGGSITGTITARDGGAAVASAFLLLEREDGVDAAGAPAFRFGGYTQSGVDGRYAFLHVADGRFHVTAYPTSGALCQERTGEIIVQGGVTMGATGLALVPGGSVSVTVRRADGGPVAGAAVTFTNADGVAVGFDRDSRTDAQGRYTAHGVKAGRWIVAAEQTGLRRAELAVEVQVGVESQADLLLAPQP